MDAYLENSFSLGVWCIVRKQLHSVFDKECKSHKMANLMKLELNPTLKSIEIAIELCTIL